MSNELMDEINGRFLDDPRERIDPRNRIDIRAVSEAERVPMGGNRLRLTLPKREGYHRRWMNDVLDRLARAKAGGYTHILKTGVKVGTGPESGHTDLGNVVSMVVGTHDDGRPMRAYAMEIRQDWYDADQYKKRAGLRQVEADMQRGEFETQDGDPSNRYIPEEGIKIGG